MTPISSADGAPPAREAWLKYSTEQHTGSASPDKPFNGDFDKVTRELPSDAGIFSLQLAGLTCEALEAMATPQQ